MQTVLLELALLPLIGSMLTGCETVASLARGMVEPAGQTIFLAADLATFRALSTLSYENETCAYSSSDPDNGYGTLSPARAHASDATHVPSVASTSSNTLNTYPSGASSTTSFADLPANTTRAQRHARYAPLGCVSLQRGRSGSNDVIQNACGHVVEAHWRDVNGSWSMFPVHDSYTVYGARVSELWACHKNDSLDKATVMCIDNDGSDRW